GGLEPRQRENAVRRFHEQSDSRQAQLLVHPAGQPRGAAAVQQPGLDLLFQYPVRPAEPERDRPVCGLQQPAGHVDPYARKIAWTVIYRQNEQAIRLLEGIYFLLFTSQGGHMSRLFSVGGCVALLSIGLAAQAPAPQNQNLPSTIPETNPFSSDADLKEG